MNIMDKISTKLTMKRSIQTKGKVDFFNSKIACLKAVQRPTIFHMKFSKFIRLEEIMASIPPKETSRNFSPKKLKFQQKKIQVEKATNLIKIKMENHIAGKTALELLKAPESITRTLKLFPF